MNYKKWKLFFNEITNNLDLDFENDARSAEILNQLLKNKKNIKTKDIKNLILDKDVFVFGAGPSLESDIKKYRSEILKNIKIASDGTTSALLEKGIIPDIIVTDLDGDIPDQIRANGQGCIVLLHAHGNNIDKIEKFVSSFKGPVLGTTQINPSPFEYLFNFGGFTDGDRAIFLADHFNANKIHLIGFDFSGSFGKYSFTKNKDLKLKKLKWCKFLIKELNKESKRIYFL